MVKATWNGTVLAESNETVVVDGNHYFPPQSITRDHFSASEHTTECGWKGVANYYHVVVGDERNDNAAWYYASPKPEAKQIAGYVAFWKGVVVQD